MSFSTPEHSLRLPEPVISPSGLYAYWANHAAGKLPTVISSPSLSPSVRDACGGPRVLLGVAPQVGYLASVMSRLEAGRRS